jgi:thioredoxin reductase
MAAQNRFIIKRRDKDDLVDDVVIECEGLTIGQFSRNDVVLNHRAVSRLHAGIREIRGEFWLFNLATVNSTLLNGEVIEMMKLADGDVIQIGPFLVYINYVRTALSITVERELLVYTEAYARSQAAWLSAETIENNAAILIKMPPKWGASTLTPGGARRLEGTGILRATLPAEDEKALDVFWQQRKKDLVRKAAAPRLLHPRPGQRLGRLQFNWRPTTDLSRVWRKSYFYVGAALVTLACVAAVVVYKPAYWLGPVSAAHANAKASVGALPWSVWVALLGLLPVAALAVMAIDTARRKSALAAATRQPIVEQARNVAGVWDADEPISSDIRKYYDAIEHWKEVCPPYPHPYIYRDFCIGCGACVDACPHDVLALVGGYAVPVALDQCMEDTACTVECPTSPKSCIVINATKPIRSRKVPMRDPKLMTNVEGLYIVGDISGTPLIKNAINEGAKVVDYIQETLQQEGPNSKADYDVAIIGVGPAGLSAAIIAKQRGLRYVAIERERVVSTIARYPAGGYVFFKPDTVADQGGIPLYGIGDRKEAMIAGWMKAMTDHGIVVYEEENCRDIKRQDHGFYVITEKGIQKTRNTYTARCVILAIGNRVAPQKLRIANEDMLILVPEEQVVGRECVKCGAAREGQQQFCVKCQTPLPVKTRPAHDDTKVKYSLTDPDDFKGKRCLVVGANNSAIAAAVELTGYKREGDRFAFTRDNEVTLVLHSDLKADLTFANRINLHDCMDAERIKVLFGTAIKEIKADEVVLMNSRRNEETARIPNDYVFVLIGGEKPMRFLESLGIRFG